MKPPHILLLATVLNLLYIGHVWSFANFTMLTSLIVTDHFNVTTWITEPEKYVTGNNVCRNIKIPRVILKEITGKKYKKIEVFGHVRDRTWEKLYTTYWDPSTMSPLLTTHRIFKNTDQDDVFARATSTFRHNLCSHGLGQRPGNVLEGSPEDSEPLLGWYSSISPTVDTAFQKNVQEKSFQNQRVTLDPRNTRYFQRGHLVPNADFNFEDENRRDATFLYINVVPQWANVNNGNWKKLEKYLQDKTRSHHDFTVYTLPLGQWRPHGVTTAMAYAAPGKWERIIVPSQFAKVIVGRGNNCANTFIVDNSETMDHPHQLNECELKSGATVNKL